MTKSVTSNKDGANAGTTLTFRLLKAATAKKLGKQSEGEISYRLLADLERQCLYLTITGNEGGGYFSREIVPFGQVDACVAKREQEKPFPSKLFKEAFTGRSSNNAGFLAAILRAEGLLAAAPDTETQHILSGDWSNWKKSLLAETGTTIDIDAAQPAEKQAPDESISDHTDHTERRKTLTVKRQKSDGSPSSSPAQDG